MCSQHGLHVLLSQRTCLALSSCLIAESKRRPLQKGHGHDAGRQLQTDVSLAVLLTGERKRFVISHSSRLLPLVILKLMASW